MYYGYNHPRTGPAAMPSPSSKCAPYYSGRRDTFEEFLAHFEALADDCMLTDPQRVETITRYMAPSVGKVLRSVDGFCSRDWSHFRQFLIDVFGSPRHLLARQKLLGFVQDSSRKRMICEDDVLHYHRRFSSLADPIVHTRHLPDIERDAAFWCGFHPKDRSKLRPALLAKYPYQPDDDPFPFAADVLSCTRAAFAYHDPFPSWSQEEPYKPQKIRHEQPAVEHVSRDTYGIRLAPRAVASNAETAPSNPLSPSQLTTDPQLPFPSSVSRSELHHTPETAPIPLTLPSSSISPTDSERPQPATDVQPQNELEPMFDLSTPPSSLPRPIPSSMSYSLEPSVTDDDSELTFMPAAPLVLSAVLESPPSSVRWTTEDHLEPDPVPSTVPIFHSLPSTLSFASLSAGDVSEIAVASPTEPPANLAPLPSAFLVLPASSDLPSATLSPSLTLGDLEPESTPASNDDSDTVSLSFPERLPLSSSDIVPPLPEFSLSVPASPHPLPTDSTVSTILMPPGLLKLSPNDLMTPPSPISSTPLMPPSLLRLSPNGPIKPTSLSPLEVTTFGLIPPSLEASLDLPVPPRSLPSLSPKRPPGLTPIASQVSTPLESCPPVHQMSILADSTPIPLVSPHSSPPLLPDPDPSHFDFALTLATTTDHFSAIPSISTTPLTSMSKCQIQDRAASLSDAATPRDAFAYRFQLEQYTPRSPSFMFDPGGLASALDPTHEYAFKRNTKSRGSFTIASSITVPAPLYIHQVKTFAFVICSTPAPSVFDKSIPSTPPPLTSSPRPCDPIPVPLMSFIYTPSRSFGPCPSHSSLTDVSSSRPPSFPLVKESTSRYAPYLDPRLLCHICLFRPCFLLIPFITSLVFLVSFVFIATALGLLPSPSPLSVRPSLTQTAHARHCKTRTCSSFIITHDTSITTLIQGPILIHFSAETPAKLARRSLTGDGQDFDPPGGVRIPWALGLKSHVFGLFGLFGLGPASRGTDAISVIPPRLPMVLHQHSPLMSTPSLLSPRSTSPSPSPLPSPALASSIAHGSLLPILPSQEASQPLVARPRVLAPHAPLSIAILSPHIAFVPFKMSRLQLTHS